MAVALLIAILKKGKVTRWMKRVSCAVQPRKVSGSTVVWASNSWAVGCSRIVDMMTCLQANLKASLAKTPADGENKLAQ